MTERRLARIKQQIRRIKAALERIGEMRPGLLTRQYKRPKEKAGPYWQLSYTHKRKSRTEYVRPAFVPAIRRQIATYKRFRRLVDRWVEIGRAHV